LIASRDELFDLHCPENGTSMSTLEYSLLLECHAALKTVNSFDFTDKTSNLVEDGFIMDHPDKLMFYMKEMKAMCHEEKEAMADPFLIGHLNLSVRSNS
jgi:hypothetical protein